MAIPVRPEVLEIRPYIPGRPIAEVQRAYGREDVVKLASNENALGPSPQALLAAQAAATQGHLYPHPSSGELQATLAAIHGVDSDWVFVGSGSDEILRLLTSAYVRTGDRAFVPACSFPNYRTVSLLAGARVTEVPLRHWTMDLSATSAELESQQPPARICFLCRPNNPTGAVFSAESFRLFMAAVPSETLVVVDEAYHEFDETRFDSLRFLRPFPNLVITRTFSKAFGLAGFRVGYGLGRPDVWAPLYRVREPFSVNVVAQAAAKAAVGDTDHLVRSQRLARDGREFLYNLCNELRIEYVRSQGNFVLIDLRRPALPVHEHLMRLGVIIRPCNGFGLPNHIRVTTGTPDENLRFATALQEALAAPPESS